MLISIVVDALLETALATALFASAKLGGAAYNAGLILYGYISDSTATVDGNSQQTADEEQRPKSAPP